MIRILPIFITFLIVWHAAVVSAKCIKCSSKKRCAKGAKCQKGKCVRFVRVGSRCNPGKCVSCSKGLRCRNGRCISNGKTQGKSSQCGRKCKNNKSCGNGSLKCSRGTCTRFSGHGLGCGGCVKCKDALQCHKARCIGINAKIPAKQGKKCRKDSECDRGLHCSSRNRCVKPNGLKGKCDGIFWGCQKKFMCIKDQCFWPPERMPKCGECDHPEGCLSGLNCQMYSPGKGRCVSKLKLGEDCSDVCDDCDNYMTCRRDGKCGPNGEEKCSLCKRDIDCMDGLICNKDASGLGRCAALGGKGSKCSNRCSVCQQGLVCRDGEVCDDPRGNKCNDCRTNSDCTDSLVCKVENKIGHQGRCAMPMILGARCTGPCLGCHPGLVCSANKICVQPKQDWCESCQKDTDCLAGLICKTSMFSPALIAGKCARPMNAGQNCGNPCWGCKHGLECKHVNGDPICVKVKQEVCRTCTQNSECRDGLVCKNANPANFEQGTCAKIMTTGASCSDPCWACKKGLTCVGGELCESQNAELCAPCSATENCKEGLHCKKEKQDAKLGRCAERKKLGEGCEHECWTCPSGSICKLGICRQ